MLVIHSSSICDVCYTEYLDKNPASAIPCGHIFCYICLTSCQPRNCPLCRRSFKVDQITKLRTDTNSEELDESQRCRASSSSSKNPRHERRSCSDFDERVVSHLKDTRQMVQEVTERISLHAAVEASYKVRLSEVESERDFYKRKLADTEDSLRSAQLVEESIMARLQRTVVSYESKIDDMEEQLDTAKAIEMTLLDEIATLGIGNKECTEVQSGSGA